jgi:hypothetical protein
MKTDFDPVVFIFGLFNIASNLQNTQSPVSLYDIFTDEELFDLWQCKNYKLYVQYANAISNNGVMMDNAKPLLSEMMKDAELAVSNKSNGVALRFGHDGNIIPLSMLMRLEGTYDSILNPADVCKHWCDFRVAPMAGNIQIVFYRNDISDEVIVKFLYNEQEVHVPQLKSSILPFYKWRDVTELYASLLAEQVN